MLDFEKVWKKICNEYVEDFGNISYHIAEKGSFGSNRPKTLYIEISIEDYDDSDFNLPFTNIKDWLYKNSNTHEYCWDSETHHFNDFDVIINIID